MYIRILLIIVAVSLLTSFGGFFGLIIWSTNVLEREQQQVISAYEQVRSVKELKGMINRQFTELSFYLLSGEEEDIEHFNQAKQAIFDQFSGWQQHIEDTVSAMRAQGEDEDEIEEELSSPKGWHRSRKSKSNLRKNYYRCWPKE